MRTQHCLLNSFTGTLLEAGCDEAGRGCLAGPVFAAAVILPEGFSSPDLNDSKLLTAPQRQKLRKEIEEKAIAWSVASVDHNTIDRINILQASFKAMHEAVRNLSITPQLLLIDGNRFNPFPGIPHECFVKGDGRFLSIAAASVLAKTHRDEFMTRIYEVFPQYGWDRNKGYPTETHIRALQIYGPSPWHRLTFQVKRQIRITF
ncbi:MAG: ribonuclease HII [Bacteroidales bacterium]|nr:ribonuclease HII [Bacteroidales bacterium]